MDHYLIWVGVGIPWVGLIIVLTYRYLSPMINRLRASIAPTREIVAILTQIEADVKGFRSEIRSNNARITQVDRKVAGIQRVLGVQIAETAEAPTDPDQDLEDLEDTPEQEDVVQLPIHNRRATGGFNRYR